MNHPSAIRQNLSLLFAVLFSVSLLFAWSTVAEQQSLPEGDAVKSEEAAVSVHAAKRGNPYVNFEDGRALNLGANASGTQPVAMVSADFDSDGFADVVTADASGGLQLLKGIDPANFALRPDMKMQPRPEPFAAKPTGASFGFSPDFMFAGDLNADGKQDIIAAVRGSDKLSIVIGDGYGRFSQPVIVTVGGNITAVQSGEIGKPDGQADLAVTYTNKNGSFLAVYEHPESAFRHAPEVIKLPSSATAIAIGNMDEDYYSDIAVACGNDLVVVHERGQVYPWDVVKDSGIMRPPAFVEIRKMPFSIASMAIGRFGKKRGTTLAMLGGDGNMYRLEPARKTGASNNTIPNGRLANSTSLPFSPTDAEPLKYAMLTDRHLVGQSIDAAGNPIVNLNEVRMARQDEYLKKRGEEIANSAKKYTPDEISNVILQTRTRKAEMDVRRKAAFISSISARSSSIREWQMETIANGSQFAALTAGGHAELARVNVSDSDLDDLMVTSKGSGEINFISRQKDVNGSLRAEVSSISAASGVNAVLPVRINLDGLNDLVVLEEGSSSPSVVMSAPMSIFWVNTTNDTFGCVDGGDCSLRGAIIAANSNPGYDIIGFALPPATVLTPQTELPPITTTLSIQGGALPNGTRGVEISGSQIAGAADGLKLRASSCFIFGLAINQMPNTVGGGSAIGGNGITLESTSSSPNNGSNYVVGLYLGTDATGNIKRANTSTGMLIFDSDNNAVGGPGDSFRNVLSGNDLGGHGLDVIAGNSNKFQNNIIGLNGVGTAKLGNNLGAFVSGFNNQFGGDNVGEGNTISGNGKPYPDDPNRCYGSGLNIILLYDAITHEPLTLNTTLRGNRIGTDPGGTLPLGNCYAGVYTSPLHQTTIGSITETGRNIIGDNGWTAIRCIEEIYDISQLSEGGYCAIAGNNIGTNVTGTVSLGNDDRNFQGGLYRFFGNVDLYLNLSYSYFGVPGGTTTGGACTGFCNLYAGNYRPPPAFSQFNDDIYVTGYSNVGIFNNSIGVNESGNQALANFSGINTGVLAGDFYVGGIGSDNGNEISLGNIISGQKERAIGVSGGFANGDCAGPGTALNIQGNKIGTDATGTFAISNGYDDSFGLYIDNTVAITRGFTDTGSFGGDDPFARNVVSGNAGDALTIGDACFAALPVSLPVSNNLIGLNSALLPLGNGGNGISIAASFVQVGGSDTSANQIAFNGSNIGSTHAGITVLGRNGRPAVGNPLRGNLIHDNNGLGIDLGSRDPRPAFNVYGPDGVTGNDLCDLDSDFGPNLLQNFPTLFAPTYDQDGHITVGGTLISRPRQSFTIDLYANQAADPTGHGEGQFYLGSVSVDTNGNGFSEFTYSSAVPVTPNQAISATATDTFGNTSEFSCSAGQSCDGLRGYQDIRQYLADPPPDQCPVALIVNIDTDQNDENENDGVCDVDTNTDGYQCSLRAAIQVVTHQGYSGPKRIKFAIPGPGVHTIHLDSQLPDFSVPIDLDATTQPGYSGSPLIKIDGNNSTAVSALRLTGGNSYIKGLSIVSFQRGIEINGPNGSNDITSCYIGVNADGATGPTQRMQTGILIQFNSSLNRIGSREASNGNLISNNVSGVAITGNSNTNQVFGNRIGTTFNGSARFPNDRGVVIDASKNNIIGDDLDTPNIIAGNDVADVVLQNNASNNNVGGNFIGVDGDPANSTTSHGSGVLITDGAANNIIGGNSTNAANIIGGHTNLDNSAGVSIGQDAGTGNRVVSNRIGIRPIIPNSTPAIPNKYGVLVYSNGQFIGKTSGGADAGNVIASNQLDGISTITDTTHAIEVVIVANYVGTNGDLDLGNGGNGITLFGLVNDGTNIVRNVISGNQGWGVYIDGGQYIRLKANKIGINEIGDNHINNGAGGVYVHGVNNYVGGDNESDRNIISGNAGNGIKVAPGSDRTQIKHNRIGTDADGQNALKNSENGILLFGTNTTVDTNLISGNEKIGIRVERGEGDPEAQLNVINNNRIGTNKDGFSQVANQTGILLINGARSNTISNSLISGNLQNGVSIRRGCSGNILDTDLIGTDADGQGQLANLDKGITIEGSNNQVLRSTISGNSIGVFIAKTTVDAGADDAANNRVYQCKIGTTSDGHGKIANLLNGVVLTGGAHNNFIGGQFIAQAGEQGNVISGNGKANGDGGRGIWIYRSADVSGQTDEAPRENYIFGNYIGTDTSEQDNNGNATEGVLVLDSPSNQIGSTCTGCGNVVVGNNVVGIQVLGSGSQDTYISTNYIGANRGGQAIPNGGDGIDIESGACGTTLAYNTVSGNLEIGISIKNTCQTSLKNGSNRPNGSFPISAKLIGNIVGVVQQSQGTFVKVANVADGLLMDTVHQIEVGITTSSSTADKNIFSGNAGAGIRLRGEGSDDNNVVNSFVGTVPGSQFRADRQLLLGFGNNDGIVIEGARNTALGDINEAVGRLNLVISDNLRFGINIDGITASANKVINSLVQGNGSSGVILQNGANQNSVGGPESNAGNDINHNVGPGVWLHPTAGSGNITDPNSIYGNGGLGIALGDPNVVLPNDPGDGDPGPNNLQNYPEISNFSIDSNGDLMVSYFVDSQPGNSNYGTTGLRVEFFKADLRGQGQVFLGSDQYTEADHGLFAVNLKNSKGRKIASTAGGKTLDLGNAAALGISAGDKVTATATDADGNTSEFFPPFTPSASGVSVSGRVAFADGRPVDKVTVSITNGRGEAMIAITNAFGYYRFDNIEPGDSYVLTVTSKRVRFANPTRLLTITDVITDVDFVATE